MCDIFVVIFLIHNSIYLSSWRHCCKTKIGKLIQFSTKYQTLYAFSSSLSFNLALLSLSSYCPLHSSNLCHRSYRVKYANCTCTTSVEQSMSNYTKPNLLTNVPNDDTHFRYSSQHTDNLKLRNECTCFFSQQQQQHLHKKNCIHENYA